MLSTVCLQWGSKVWAPQLKICINVHKEAKERWKNLQKASNYRLDILIICQQKLDFISIIYTFKITENKKKWRLQKFGPPAEFTACTAPFAKLRPASVMDCSQS
ncbi:unnamed protein product, partial [Staurois parvus]